MLYHHSPGQRFFSFPPQSGFERLPEAVSKLLVPLTLHCDVNEQGEHLRQKVDASSRFFVKPRLMSQFVPQAHANRAEARPRKF